ncbi:ABC transporter ATP-binding protein [Salinicola halophilus]|uniref:ABC transporter ATP-binding protein n=1 Tax=Salinicola halophilus TaxID=184065 RepID=UPI000DA15865|nr:ABC transporter ATP-binding protein [Salinicola halophilus]
MSNLEISNISKCYEGREVLKNVGFKSSEKEFIVVVGPSGCGKSTLLKTIAGLTSVDAGRILIGEHDVTRSEPGDRDIAMVFQSYALYPHMTVAENMGFGLRMAGHPKQQIREAVEHAASILRITDYLDMRPKQLSGGQRQRVAIGRAITRSPAVFLFDEPLSNLDAALRTQMRVEIGQLYRRLDATMVYVTHDQVEAMTMATRIVLMNSGVIEQVGSPIELYTNPVNRFVAGFLGSPRMNFIEASVTEVNDDQIVVALEGLDDIRVARRHGVGVSRGDTVTLGIRPEEISVGRQRSHQLPARVELVEQLGREVIAYVDTGSIRAIESENGLGHLTIQVDRKSAMSRDDDIHIGFDAEDIYLFNADGMTMTPNRDTEKSPVHEVSEA